MEPGILEVVVQRGRNLVPKKNEEKVTSTVEIKLGKEAVGTKTVENNCNPQYNTVHRFPDVDITNKKNILELTLRDRKDKFAGRIQIPIAESLYQPNADSKSFRLEKWYPLLNKHLDEDSSIGGDIQVKLRYISPSEEKDKEDAKTRAKEKVIEEQQKDRNRLLEPEKTRSRQSSLSDDRPAGPIDDIVNAQIQDVIRETERVRTESRDSTIRTMQKIAEARETGTNTLNQLDQQGEQLRRIVGDNEQIEADLKVSARQIRGIKSIWGSLANKFSRSPSNVRKARSGARTEDEAPDSPTIQNKNGMPPSSDGNNPFGDGSQMEDQKKYGEDDVDRDLEQISNGLESLRHLAIDIGKEINSQTGTIDKLITQTDNNDYQIRKFNQKIGRK